VKLSHWPKPWWLVQKFLRFGESEPCFECEDKEIQLETFARRPHANPTAVVILGADPPDIISAPLLAKGSEIEKGSE
jgi:hypothetical protein